MKWIILGIAILISGALQAQPFIDQSKEEVKARMKEEHKDFHPDRSVVKQAYNYLKYVNNSQTITWIIYFNEQDVCTASKKVCDYSEYDFKMDELDEKYEKSGKFQWKNQYRGDEFLIRLEEQDWYFTIRESKIKEQ